MGRVGQEITSGDMAFEILNDESLRLLNRIRELVQIRERMEPDDSASLEIPLKILIYLAMHSKDLARSHPDASEVASWKTAFLEVFDEYAEENWTDEDEIKARRKELKKPFDKLIRLCEKAH